jgi:hypothetical protein
MQPHARHRRAHGTGTRAVRFAFAWHQVDPVPRDRPRVRRAPDPPQSPQNPRAQNLKLATAEVGYGEEANAALSRRLWSTYFAGQPKLFEEVFGFPASELPPGQTIFTLRVWRNEFIGVL